MIAMADSLEPAIIRFKPIMRHHIYTSENFDDAMRLVGAWVNTDEFAGCPPRSLRCDIGFDTDSPLADLAKIHVKHSIFYSPYGMQPRPYCEGGTFEPVDVWPMMNFADLGIDPSELKLEEE